MRRPWALPLVPLYWLGLTLKNAWYARHAGRVRRLACPVISVGSLSAGGLKALYGAVPRYVFDVGAWENSKWIVFGGVSGQPESPHYADQHAEWSQCKMVPMHYDWRGIAEGSTRTALVPAD